VGSGERSVTLAEVSELLDADVIVGRNGLDIEITSAFGADLMSDVLAFARPGCLLLTGLASLQTVRTAFALDIAAIVVCRGKTIPDKVIETAAELGVPVMRTSLVMFEACGRLWLSGVTGSMREMHREADRRAEKG